MIYRSQQNRKDYFPPLLGNGDIALHTDPEGSVYYDEQKFKYSTKYSGRIYRAGRRQSVSPQHFEPFPLLNFGGLKFDLYSDVPDFEQELHEADGFVSSVCTYKNGAKVTTESFVHPACNLYAVQKTFDKDFKDGTLSLILDEELLHDVISLNHTPIHNGVAIDFSVKAYENFNGRILLFSDAPCVVSYEKDWVKLEFSAKKDETIGFYYVLDDSLYNPSYTEDLKGIYDKCLNIGFSGLLSETRTEWNEYQNKGYVKTGDDLLDTVHRVAMHHLKCYTTRWSIPVGLNSTSWNGKYFAFDEYYAYLSLLQAQRTDLAKRVPAFRLKGLSVATYRATDYSKNPDVVQARYPWQTGEHSEELTRPGFWEDHIFHMAVIAMGAFQYYEYTMDKAFLEECYPMIKACAKFYTLNSVYQHDDGSFFVGKCTDLERLGSSVTNPFFTSCGVIKTLECLIKASEILDCDADYRAECDTIAKSLRETLPHDGEKYVPFKGSVQKSVAVCTGKYPFDVLKNDDPKLLPALMEFVKYETTYGNMYPYGKKVSTWYAAWKACAFARSGYSDEAYKGIMQAIESVGAFGECYEINEETAVSRAWFVTAAGVLCTAIHESLIQSDGENIYLLPAAPELMTDVSFKLAVKGGAVAEVEIKDNKLVKCDISFLPTATPKKFNIYLRGEKQ